MSTETASKHTMSVKSLMTAFKNDITPETKELTELEMIAKYQMANRSVKGIVR